MESERFDQQLEGCCNFAFTPSSSQRNRPSDSIPPCDPSTLQKVCAKKLSSEEVEGDYVPRVFTRLSFYVPRGPRASWAPRAPFPPRGSRFLRFNCWGCFDSVLFCPLSHRLSQRVVDFHRFHCSGDADEGDATARRRPPIAPADLHLPCRAPMKYRWLTELPPRYRDSCSVEHAKYYRLSCIRDNYGISTRSPLTSIYHTIQRPSV